MRASCNLGHEAPEHGRTDWRGVSRLRTELQVDLEARFSGAWRGRIGAKGFYDAIYAVRGRDEFTRAVREEYEDEVELREVYLLGRLSDDLDLKAGRQIVVWGNSDNIRVTDVLNPLDMREPGLTDIEDLRLPVTMTKLDYYTGDWNLSGIAIHEIRFDKTLVFDHDFYPGTAPAPPEKEPAQTLENTGWGLSLEGIFSGWDIDFYYARIFNDTPHTETVSRGPPPVVRRKHGRLDMLGVAYNKALGNWLLKTEAALLDGLEFFNRPHKDYTRIDALVGVEYAGFKETTVSLEFADRHLLDYDGALESAPDGVQEDMFQSVLRYQRDFRNDTLTLTVLASVFGPGDADGAFERLSLEYDLTDAVELRGGAVLYQSGDRPGMQRIGDSDRVFMEIQYHF